MTRVDDDLTIQYVFIGTGTFATVTSLLAIIVIVSQSKLRSSYALFLGLAAADLFNSIGFLISGAVRLPQIKSGLFYTYTTPRLCTQQYHFFITLLGLQWPTVATLTMSVERFLVLQAPMWYRIYWNDKVSVALVVSGFAFSMLSSCGGVVTAYTRDQVNLSLTCGTGQTAGIPYSAYNYGFTILAGTLSLVLSLMTVKLVTEKILSLHKKMFGSNNTASMVDEKMKLKKQRRLVLTVTLVSILNFVLTIIPNVVSLLVTTAILAWPYGNLSFWMLKNSFCINSAFTLFAFGAVNPDFRLTLKSLVSQLLRKTPIITDNKVRPTQTTKF